MICGGRNTPGGDKMTLTDTEETQFDKLIRPIALDQKALRMKKYIQHGKVTTYSHSLRVAKTAFALNRLLHAGCDERRLVRAAFLHDYFLYDWHTHGDKLHGYHHPEIAAENAARDFGLDQKEQSIIRTHMWPLTLFHVPASREAWIVTIADKLCGAEEI